MFGTSHESKYLPKAAEFYYGKSVFLTGAAGFIGTVLLEALLRCYPGIKSIYLLLRSKKNLQPEDRKEQIFSKRIFEKLVGKNREILEKVHVIPGDIALPNLGMREEDIQFLTEEVSIVFHPAAITHLHKPLKFALINNVLGLNSIIEFCRRLKKLEAFVYTSTAYSNCNHTNVILEEEVYRLPFRAEKFLDALKNEDDGKLQVLFSQCKPDWPNTYTFSKCLAENLIMDTALDLPIAIIRPSIVVGTWKDPIPGYEDIKTVSTAFFVGAGKGFLKVVYADPNCRLNFVPVDTVVNAHVIAALSIGTKRCALPMIVHCTATEKFHVRMSDYNEIVSYIAQKFPVPQSFTQPGKCILVPNKYLYYILVAYHHYIPAIVLDVILKAMGKKSRVYASYCFVDKIMNSTSHFRFKTFCFKRNSVEYLDKLIHPDDRKDMALDFKNATFLEYSLKVPEISPLYDWKTDAKSPKERENIKYWFHVIINCIQGMFIIVLFWSFCSIFL